MATAGEQPVAPLDAHAPQGVTLSRPSTSSAAQPLIRIPQEMNGHASNTLRPVSNGGPVGRPSLLRARSDFGPRHSHLEQPSDSADEASSADGHFKIRHGWDDQLNSEEYNNILTSVGSPQGLWMEWKSVLTPWL
jgi:regulator-associated protein of mTOR